MQSLRSEEFLLPLRHSFLVVPEAIQAIRCLFALERTPISFFVHPVFVATKHLQIAKLCELTKIAFGCSWIEAEVFNDFFCRNPFFIIHKFQNIDQFLYQ